MKLLLFPGDLSWDYSFDSIPLMRAEWCDVRALAVASTYLGLVSLAAWSFAHGRRRVVLGLQSVIIPFVPASNLFFTVGVTVGERLLYPSTVGVAIIVAALGQHVERSRRRMNGSSGRLPSIVASFCYMLIAVYTWRCGVRVRQWESSEALYAADAAAWPNSVKTQHQLATVYHAQSRYEEALWHYNKSLTVLDDNALTDHCIAQIFIETGRYAEALQRFEKIQNGHGVGFSRFNLWAMFVDHGFTLVALRQFQEAIPRLEHGLKMN